MAVGRRFHKQTTDNITLIWVRYAQLQTRAMATLLSRSQSGLPKQLRNFRSPGARAYLGVVSSNLGTSKDW